MLQRCRHAFGLRCRRFRGLTRYTDARLRARRLLCYAGVFADLRCKELFFRHFRFAADQEAPRFLSSLLIRYAFRRYYAAAASGFFALLHFRRLRSFDRRYCHLIR